MVNNRKKILLFIDWYLPGFKAGGPIQSCANLIAHLSDRFDFSVITRDTDYTESKPYSNIKSNAWNVLPNGTRVFYFSKENLNRSAIKELIAQEPYDYYYINGIFSFYFSIIPLLLLKSKKNVLVVGRGMFAPGALAVKSNKKKFFLIFSKLFGLFKNVTFHATNEEEGKQIRLYFKENLIKVAPNLPKKSAFNSELKKVKECNTLKLVNVARIAPEKNLDYALSVLSKVTNGNVQFDFYGPVYDENYWAHCSKLINELPSNIKATHKGVVDSDKVEELISQYHFMFMPTRGENFGHIILQSLTTATPVIISDKTPWNNIKENMAGYVAPLDNMNAFVNAINECVKMDQHLYDKLSMAALKMGQEYINDKTLLESNQNLFN